MLAIKNNIMAVNTARQLGKSYDALATSVERLSSGLRINSAKDDAAGLAVRELIRADVAVLNQGARNARDGISMLQVAEGALGTMDDILIRMSELAEQAATDSYSSEQRGIMNNEFQQLIDEIDRIAGNTSFNSINLLAADANGSVPEYEIHIGTDDTVTVSGGDMSADGLDIGGAREAATAENWVGSNTATFIEEDGGDANGGQVNFAFANQDSIDVLLASNTTYNVTEFAALVNVQSQGTTEAYDAASVVYDASTGSYSVKIEANEVGATHTLTVTETNAGASDVEWGDGTDVDAAPGNDFTLQTGGGTNISIDSKATALTALTAVTSAIETKDTTRAKLGYLMNRLQAAAAVIDIQSENLQAAESRISDVDVATEMAALTRTQVLAQAGISMLSQANQMPQMALKLLG